MTATPRRERAPRAPKGDRLPLSLPPRGISRVEAAAYVGVSVTLFDRLVDDGRMPPPKRIDARLVWDVRALDRAFDALPGGHFNDEAASPRRDRSEIVL